MIPAIAYTMDAGSGTILLVKEPKMMAPLPPLPRMMIEMSATAYEFTGLISPFGKIESYLASKSPLSEVSPTQGATLWTEAADDIRSSDSGTVNDHLCADARHIAHLGVDQGFTISRTSTICRFT